MCHSLKDIVIPSTVTTIEARAFGYCSQFTEISLPESVTYVAPDFYLASNFRGSRLANIFVDSNNESYMDINGVLFSKNGETLILLSKQKAGH